MDGVTSPLPPKRLRTMETATIQQSNPNQFLPMNKRLLDSIQQSKFTKVQRVLSINGKQTSNSLQAVPYPSMMKFVPNKEVNISNKMQKLRLKSPDGRDLGEINVKLFPQRVDGIGGRTITLKKHSAVEKSDNQPVSILKPMNKKIVSPSTSSCVSLNNVCAVKSTQQETVTTNSYTNAEPKVDLRQFNSTKCTTTSNGLPNPKVILVKVDQQPSPANVKLTQEDSKKLLESPVKPKVVMVRAENYPNSSLPKKNTACSTMVELRSYPSNKESESSALSTFNARNSSNVALNSWDLLDLPSTEMNQGGKMTVTQSSANGKCDKQTAVISNESPNVSSSKSSLVRTYSKAIENGAGSSYGENIREPPVKSMEIKKIGQRTGSGLVKAKPELTRCIKISKNGVISVTYSKPVEKSSAMDEDESKQETKKSETAVVASGDKEKTKSDKNPRENIMVILHEDANALDKSEKSKSVPEKETNSMEVDIDTAKGSNSPSKSCEEEKTTTKDSKLDEITQGKTSNAALANQQDLDIIEKALSTLPDQDLREKALKALADCGIGIKRQVPVPPVVSVHDSQTQTTVFSLLKPDTMLELSKSHSILTRLQIADERCLPPEMQYPNIPLMQQPNELDPILGEDLLSTNESLSFASDIANLFESYIPDTETAKVNEIKNLLTKPDPKVLRIFEQLQKDYHAATTIDSDGFFGIHKAVLNENISDIKRQLIVLKALGEDVDLPTASGKVRFTLLFKSLNTLQFSSIGQLSFQTFKRYWNHIKLEVLI